MIFLINEFFIKWMKSTESSWAGYSNSIKGRNLSMKYSFLHTKHCLFNLQGMANVFSNSLIFASEFLSFLIISDLICSNKNNKKFGINWKSLEPRMESF